MRWLVLFYFIEQWLTLRKTPDPSADASNFFKGNSTGEFDYHKS